LWDIAALEKRLGHTEEARAAFEDLIDSRNPYRARALEALAKLTRRQEKLEARFKARLTETMRP
jgi:hypothetical protein